MWKKKSLKKSKLRFTILSAFLVCVWGGDYSGCRIGCNVQGWSWCRVGKATWTWAWGYRAITPKPKTKGRVRARVKSQMLLRSLTLTCSGDGVNNCQWHIPSVSFSFTRSFSLAHIHFCLVPKKRKPTGCSRQFDSEMCDNHDCMTRTNELPEVITKKGI